MAGEKSMAVFLNYNGLRHLEYCLPTFLRASKGKVKGVVVDSGSTDGSQEFVRANYPEIELIQLPKNLGWAGGNNVGISYCLSKGADYVFLLNTDLKLHPDFFEALIRAGKNDPRAGVLGCKIYYMGTKTLQAAGGGMLNPENPVGAKQFGEGEVDRGQWDKPLTLDYVYEPALAVKAEVFRKIGLLDPEWFILMEGPDFCLRAKKAGFKTVYVPGARVEHEVSGTTNKKKNRRVSWKFYAQIRLAGGRNGLRFMLKHFTLLQAARYTARAFEDAVRKIPAHPHLLFLIAYGVLWNLVHLPRTLSIRGRRREDYENLYEGILSPSGQN